MLTRREFITGTAVGIAGLACLGPFSISAGAAELFPTKKRRVVVVGGGFGGATTARYLKQYAPDLEVLLIEQNRQYVTCPSSNLVLSGLMQMSAITHGYSRLARQQGVRVVHAVVTGIDPVTRYVETAQGKIAYDRLVVAPGIDFAYEGIAGMDAEGRKRFPHAWKAGPQTLQLAGELAAPGRPAPRLCSLPVSWLRSNRVEVT